MKRNYAKVRKKTQKVVIKKENSYELVRIGTIRKNNLKM